MSSGRKNTKHGAPDQKPRSKTSADSKTSSTDLDARISKAARAHGTMVPYRDRPSPTPSKSSTASNDLYPSSQDSGDSSQSTRSETKHVYTNTTVDRSLSTHGTIGEIDKQSEQPGNCYERTEIRNGSVAHLGDMTETAHSDLVKTWMQIHAQTSK
jgi:hypothetical protein